MRTYAITHPEQHDEIWQIIKNAFINVISNIYTPYCVEPIISFINTSIDPDLPAIILRTHLLPLYRHERLNIYSTSLTNLIVKIIDDSMPDQLDSVEFLIKHFPYQCGRKQFLFITAINSIINIIFDLDLNQISQKLILFLGATLKTPNIKLIEASARILLKPCMTSLLFKNTNLSIENLNEPLNFLSSEFWDSSIRSICKKALTTLVNISYEVKKNGPVSNSVNTSRLPVMSKKCQGEVIEKKDNKTENSELVAKWALVARCASKKDESIDLTKSLLHIHQRNILQVSRKNSLKL